MSRPTPSMATSRPLRIQNRDAVMIGPDDPAVRMDPPQLDGELQFRRIVLKRFRDQGAIVRMDAAENQVRVVVKLLRATSRQRQAGGVDVVVASWRRDPITIHDVSSILEQALKQLLSLVDMVVGARRLHHYGRVYGAPRLLRV